MIHGQVDNYNMSGVINTDALMFNYTTISNVIPDIKILGVGSIAGPNYTTRTKSNGFVGLAPFTFQDVKSNKTDSGVEEESVSILSDLIN